MLNIVRKGDDDMRNNRIQVLLDDETMNMLKEEAERERRSISFLVNDIIKERYKKSTKEEYRCENEEKIAPVVTEKIDYAAVVNMYNEICKSYPKVKSLSDSRKKAIKARLVKHTVEEIKEVFEKAEASDFMRGCNSKN